ncbi:MAG: phage major capsid protein [Myxococcales bacterium]|nr:phage major capsid protein [Myxococcales bacterium]
MSNPTGKLHRFRALEVEASALRAQGGDSDELLELEFAFASETPVERYFGSEILEVTPKAARLDRVAQGVCPVLENHWSDRVVGRVLEVRIAGGVARCRVRFSRSELARGVVQDVVDGIRQAVSFGYRVHRMELVESGDEGDTYRVTDWELFEVTIAAIPADPTIGVHRAADEPDLTPLLEAARSGRQEGSRMTISNAQLAELEDDEFEARIAKWPEAKQAGAREARRRILIENLCREFRAENELRDQALREGWETQRVIEAIRDERARTGRALPVSPDPDRFALRGAPTYSVRDRYGLDEHDVPRSNILTDSRAYLEGRHREIGPTIELSDHLRASDGRKDWPGAFTYHASTFYRSAFQGLAQRTIGKVNPNTTGAALVGVDHMAANWIDSFRARLLLGRLLIQIFAGLVSDVAFPKKNANSATAWVDENAGSGESSPSFTSVTMTPHTCRGRIDLTRRIMNQASPAAAQITEAELAASIAQAIDIAGLAGSGTGAEPEGILAASGVGSVTYDATSGATERQTFLDLVSAVAATNSPMNATGFVTTTTMRARLQGKPIDPGSGLFVWRETDDPNEGRVVGERVLASNNVPGNLGAGTNEHAVIYGDWSDLMLGLWSTVDIMPDLVTLGDSGGMVIRAFQDVDFALRHAASFAVSQVNPAS